MTAAVEVFHGETHGGGHGVPLSSSMDGPAPKRIVVAYGFWLFLLSDIVMFSAIFATYAVLAQATDGGPSGAQLFDYTNVAVETGCLLLSSFTCGMMALAINEENRLWTYVGGLVTFLLGAAFLTLELREFLDMIDKGATPERSAFLSAFFTLVGCHGAHVTIGLLWLVVMMAQVAAKGFRQTILRRIACFSLFWHALDIIWVALFSIVYLMGGR
jgi:cytochrome o ubiquinol oxidase subunit 3